MSLTKFGHALTKFDQISVMGGRGGGVAIWWWVLWQHGCCLLGQRMTRTKVRRDPAEKIFREGAVVQFNRIMSDTAAESVCARPQSLL